MTNKYSVSANDRIISMLTYITAGWAGFIYAIIYFFLKKKLSPFLKYNILQAIFISFAYYVLCLAIGLIFSILSNIPIIQIVVSWVQLIFNQPVFFSYSIIQVVVIGLFLYMAIVSLGGKYPRVYGVSKIIENSF